MAVTEMQEPVENTTFDTTRALMATRPTWYLEDLVETYHVHPGIAARDRELRAAAADILTQRAPTAIPPAHQDGSPSWRAYYAGWSAEAMLTEAQRLAAELMQLDDARLSARGAMSAYHAALYRRYDVLEAMRPVAHAEEANR